MRRPDSSALNFDDICSVSDDERAFYSYLSTYESVIESIEARAQALSRFMEQNGKRDPIDTVKSRIKSTDGIRAKLDEKGLDYTLENLASIKDIAGVRIICPFIDDVYTVEDYFMSQADLKLVDRRDYIDNPKASGYKSLHLIMETELHFPGESQTVLVEIQIRTIAMELWGNIEHRLRYKMNLPSDIDAEILERLVAYSNLIGALDADFKEMRERVERGTASR